MDAHFFRLLAHELCRLLEGARLEKIHGPRPGLLAFTLFSGGRKRRLYFQFERQSPLLFFSAERLPNPLRPTAQVMRLRKYCAGRRIFGGEVDFAARRALFHLRGADGAYYLILDMVHGASVEDARPEGFGAPPSWPEAADTDPLCGVPWQGKQGEGPWRRFMVLTPFLRETLAALSPEEGRALLVDLEAGGGDVFLYADAEGRPRLPLAWPLPPELCRRRSLDCEALPLTPDSAEAAAFLPWLGAATEAAALLPDYPALAAACLAWEKVFFASRSVEAGKEAAAPERRAEKKREKLIAKLAREEERLRAMLALREDAVALQAELWRYGPHEKLPEIRLEGGEGRTLALNPLLSVRENMARMFKESARGARGLAMLAERLQALARELPARNMQSRAGARAEGEVAGGQAGEGEAGEPDSPAGARPAPFPPEGDIPGVARFLSSDGFVILRGKNARGNQRLLKIGSGHDLWLHVEQGPSAHAIIRRSHGAEEVPERTLLEAGALVAAKSRFGDDAAADVMVALLRHVRPVKGAAPGTVRVDAVLRAIRVAPAREAR